MAEDTDNFNRRCAVKQLAPSVRGTQAMQQAVKLFEQEARQLKIWGQHPQIPTLHGYFEEQYWYVVQEFVDINDLYVEHGYGWLDDWKTHGNYRASESLAKILDKLLQKEAKKRYQSASEVLRELNPQPISIPTPPPPVPVGSGGVKKPRSGLFSMNKLQIVSALATIVGTIITVATYLPSDIISVDFVSFAPQRNATRRNSKFKIRIYPIHLR